MEKKNILKKISAAADLVGVFIPQIATAKSLVIGGKDLLFKEEIENLDPKKLEKMLKDEKFVHLLLQVQDACRRSKEEEKARFFTKFFRTIVKNESLSKVESDDFEEFIYLFSSLSFREILTLHKIREVTMRDPMIRTMKGIRKNGIIHFNEGEEARLKKYRDEFNEVFVFLMSVKINNVSFFLKKLEKTGLIKRLGSYGFDYVSTFEFERIYQLSEDLDNYLDECMKN